jgi:hypothetical protein
LLLLLLLNSVHRLVVPKLVMNIQVHQQAELLVSMVFKLLVAPEEIIHLNHTLHHQVSVLKEVLLVVLDLM